MTFEREHSSQYGYGYDKAKRKDYIVCPFCRKKGFESIKKLKEHEQKCCKDWGR